MFYQSELGKDLSDYKNSKAHNYYKPGWFFQPLQYHNLSGSKYCIIRGECRKSQSIKDPFHRLWIILEKTEQIRTCHFTCMSSMGETYVYIYNIYIYIYIYILYIYINMYINCIITQYVNV